MQTPSGDSAAIREHLRTLIGDEEEQVDLADVPEDENLLANGMIDSLGILKLVSFIENRFEVEVPDEDVTVQNFRSLKDIGDYLERRRTGGEP